MNTTPFNFDITSSAEISKNFTERQVTNFVDACSYVRQLPYKRNSSKHNLAIVFTDQCGTCGTKHALLRQLAIENDAENVKLMLGIFKMSKTNTPQITATLEKNGLEYIPEAHNYLLVNGEIVDCTKTNFGTKNFVADLLSSIEIQPGQITEFKVNYHQQVLKEWLSTEPGIKLSVEELWMVREQCIADLSN